MVLPVLKLGTLALKTLSKPIAARLKSEAGKHPKFRNFIISIAQSNHRIQTKMQRRIYSHATNVEIRPLNEEKAVQAAVDLLGELFVFSILRNIVHTFRTRINLKLTDDLPGIKHYAYVSSIFEVQRSSCSEAKKEEVRKQELAAVRQRNEALSTEVEILKLKLHEIELLAKGGGLSGVPVFKLKNNPEEGKTSPPGVPAFILKKDPKEGKTSPPAA